MLRTFSHRTVDRRNGSKTGQLLAATDLRWPVVAVLFAGLVLRLMSMAQLGLHPDEAFYASWALRIAEGRDPMLLTVLVDKPPFLPYLLATFLWLSGHTGAGSFDPAPLVAIARLAASGASVAGIALLWAVAKRVYAPRPALWAAALYAVSPLAVRLSPSLLTDPWLVLWMLLGLWAGLQRRSWLTGLACGLAYATKQQAVLVIPLVLATYWLAPRLPAEARRDPAPVRLCLGSVARLAGGFLLIFTIVLWWDSLRWQWMPSFWDRSAAAYGGLDLVTGGDFLERAWKWSELLSFVFGGPLGVLLLAGTAVALAAGQVRLTTFDKLLLGFAAAYLGVHWITSIAPWDRYALPLVPLLALLLGHGTAWLWAPTAHRPDHLGARAFDACERSVRWRPGLAVLVIAAVVHGGWLASARAIPVGDASAYDGVEQVAEHVRQAEPAGSILFHHRLGWHFGFYLANDPVDLRYWDTPQDLADKAAADPSARPFIALSAGEDGPEVVNALRAAGLRLRLELDVPHSDGSRSIALYRIVPLDPTPSFGPHAAVVASQSRGGHGD